jgi:hypothetical protein
VAALPDIQGRFANFAASAAKRAPLYRTLSAAIAGDPEVARLLQAAPEQQQLPVLLFAAVHFLLLHGDGPELAAYYANLTPTTATGDPYPAFRDVTLRHAAEIEALVATSSTQTNEVGRCAQFVPALGMVTAEAGPVAHVDVGTSAGLNLLLPYYAIDYEPGGLVGGPSTVHLTCATAGPVPVPVAMPPIERSIGIDRSPIDVLDEVEVRWLEACVWPDQADRFDRLVAAIALARQHVPDVRAGDAVLDLAAVVREAADWGHPVVTNSWVLNYLPDGARQQYVAELDRLGSELDLSWIIAEAPSQTPGLPVPTTDPPEELTVISLVRWRGGRRTVQRLATTHPHGYWLRWEVDAG